MVEPISLNRGRKLRARLAAEAEAAANRVKFGRTKTTKAQEALVEARSRAALEGHRRRPADASDPDQGG